MTDAVWAYAERKAGIRQDDPASWPDGPLGLSWKGLKHNRAFDVLVDNDAVQTALDAIFGPGQWLQPNPGAQALLTLPTPGAWVLPSHLAHGLWARAAVVARTGGEAVRPLRRGGAEGWWHDSPAWAHRVVDEYRCGLPRCTGAGMAQLAQAAQPPSFPGAATQRPSDTRPGPVAVGQGGDVSAVPRQMLS